MFEALYAEFGKEKVHRVRRELTAKNKEMPTYIQLVAELYLQQGPHNKSLHLTGSRRKRWAWELAINSRRS